MSQRAYSLQVLPHENVLRAIIEVPSSARSVDVSAGVAKIANAFAVAENKPLQAMLRELATGKRTVKNAALTQYIFSRGIADAQYTARFNEALREPAL